MNKLREYVSLATSVIILAGAHLAQLRPPLASAAAPVLVLSDNGVVNPFGNYLSEILRGDGLLAFDQQDRGDWSSGADPGALLASYTAVVMPEMTLAPAEQQLLREYVQSGGVLIGARPDAGLSDVYGIEFAGNRPERLLQYYGVDAEQDPGRGLTHGPLQFHGVAANYNLQGATGLAYLYANSETPTSNPAVTTHAYGQGRAIAFAFDPATSVVLTRQGNPDWQNTEGDGISQYRPHDMFARTDGRTYYDPDRLPIPHADEMQRFLANVLIDAHEAPLPRVWYLPGTHKSIMINTGDGEDNYDAQFDAVLNDAASYGGKFSVYLRDFGVANTTPAKEAQWRAAGHEVGVHAYADGAEGPGAEAYMDFAYGRVVDALHSKFGHVSRTARNHTIDWTGWVDMARIEADHGTLLDTNYYHYLNGNVVNPLTANGYFTGSGLAQRFIDENGELLDSYQVATQWPDEWFADRGMSAQQAVEIMTTMFEAAESKGYYSAFVNNIHPVRYYGADITRTWSQAIWQYCQDEGIPMWSAEMLLDFNLARNASRFENVVHSSGLMEFDYVAGAVGFDLTLMIPVEWSEQRLSEILVNGVATAFVVEEIKGFAYAMLTTPVGDAHIAASYALPASADFNQDGRVDGDDLAQWRDDFGAGPNSDADGDGDSDGADFLEWQRQLSISTTSAAARVALPEPAFNQMLALVVVTLLLPPLANRRQNLHAA
jgi:hypothetical protein